MEVHAITRNVRSTPQKVRAVARIIQGLPAEKAVETLRFIPRKSARLLGKTLKSAIANAENNNQLAAAQLTVVSARADQGPVLDRHRPSAKGSAHPIRKSTSHITITLSDDIPAEETKPAKKTRRKPAATPAAAAAAK
ncbi:MAG: 50S ribosomal protein L22 [Puniceicoccales bacterium]|jgi:large subunit ribosomal protein L22|nr:50S ribosomal protein L22 [Puniceicoccales bacterium]